MFSIIKPYRKGITFVISNITFPEDSTTCCSRHNGKADTKITIREILTVVNSNIIAWINKFYCLIIITNQIISSLYTAAGCKIMVVSALVGKTSVAECVRCPKIGLCHLLQLLQSHVVW